MTPDRWQTEVLRSHYPQALFCCSRQSGKSLVASALALRCALLRPGSLTLLLSPTQRQSGELLRDKVLRLYNGLGRPVPAVQESALSLVLSNGSRILSLPGNPDTVRGFSSVALIVLDEAACVRDELYYAIRPMLAVSRGDLVCLSTPLGKRGWFYTAWASEGSWNRVQIAASEVPRITPEFLEQERREIGDYWYRQEYHCQFLDLVGSLFSEADIEAALSSGLRPLFEQGV
jgi:hypothetical protein